MQPIIKLIKNQPSQINITVNVEGSARDVMPTVRMMIEGVDEGTNLSFNAVCEGENKWVVTIPALDILKEGQYQTSVEVVVDSQHFVAASGMAIVSSQEELAEAVNSGTMTAPGPDMQITNRFTGEPEEPIEAKLQYPVGQNNDEHLDDEDYQEYNQDKTEDIASETAPGEGPQIPQVPTPAEVAARIVSQVMGQLRKPETKGSLFNRDANGKPVIRGLEDPKTREQQLEKSRKVRDILGLD